MTLSASVHSPLSHWMRRPAGRWFKVNDLLTQLAPVILDNQGKGVMAGLLPEGPEQRLPQRLSLGDYTLNVSYERATSQNPNVLSGGLVVALAADEYVFAGTAITVTFESNKPGEPLAGILSVEEGRYVGGQWRPDRRLNGDQTHQGRHLRLGPGKFGIQRIKLYRYR